MPFYIQKSKQLIDILEENMTKVVVPGFIQKFTLDVLATSIYGVDFNTLKETPQFIQSYNELFKSFLDPLSIFLGKLVLKIPIPKYLKFYKNLNIFQNEIKR
jgi:hypothetical protein